MTTLTLSKQIELSGATGGRDLGDAGPIVLLVHGAAMDRTVWSLQTRWLAHHGCTALAVDLPGHGASPEDPLSSIEAYADWTATVVEALARPVHVVGHSMGSFIALECSQRTELASITLVGTAAAMPVHPALIDAAHANDPLAAQLMSGWAFAHHTRTAPHPSPGSSMVGSTQAMIAQAQPGVLHSDLSMCADYTQAVDTASNVKVRTRFVLGELDRMTPVRQAKTLIEAIPHSRVQVVPRVGHMIQIESPGVTRSEIARCLADD